MTHHAFLVGQAAVLAATALLVSHDLAAQEASGTGACRPVTQPTVINRPGCYVLGRSFSLEGPGAAVVIAASNVSLDLSGRTLTGPGGKQGVGIRIEGTSGARVFGGILARFGTGIEVRDANNARIEGLHIQGEDAGGPPPGEVGVLILNSRAVFVERNVISRTFLGIFVRGGGGGGNRISENTLVGGAAGQLGICYNPDDSGSPDGPSGDLVYNNLVSRFNVGIQTSTGTSGNIFRENDIAFFQTPVQELGPGPNVFAENTVVPLQP
jgi:nitrous oxidase accessory protein NosD